MKKLGVKFTAFAVACLLLMNIFVGCTYFSPIVGKWQDTKSLDILEFTRDGKVIMEVNGYIMTGEYELIGNDVIKMHFEGLGGDILSALGADNYRYSISGDTLTLEGGGASGTSTLQRVNSKTKNTRY